MEDVVNEMEEEGEGDSCASADAIDDLDSGLQTAQRERLEVLVKIEDDVEESANDNAKNCLLIAEAVEDHNMKIIKPPEDWTAPAPKTRKGEPDFVDVDNPGNWDRYTFFPVFDAKTGKYLRHKLPTGASPVPVADDGKRAVNGWEFHYTAWKSATTEEYRSGATRTNPFPKERKGRLDYELLKKLGLTKSRLMKNDALFFFQLLLPFCDTTKSGIDDDPRMSFYADVERFTQKYAATLGVGGSYGHQFNPVKIFELVRFDMCLIRDGVHGGSQGAKGQQHVVIEG